MAESQNVEFLITARDAATRVLQSIGTSFDNISRSYSSFQTLVGGAGVATALRAIAEATIEAERASNRLNAALKSTGFSAGITRAELNQIAEDLKGRSAFDDDAIRRGLSSMLRFRSVQGDMFREAAKLAVDLAAALDTDVTAAFQRLGRALEDPEKGLRALREAGLNVTSAQERVKKVMEESGDVAAAQKIILDELQKSVGGAAAGENTGLYGSVKAVGKAWDDFLKGLGKLEGENRRLQRTFEMIQQGLALITPGGGAPRGPTQSERDEASRGQAEAESAALQEAAQKKLDEQIKKIMEEREAREKRLREEDIKGWVAHAEAIIQEDFRIAESLAKSEQDEVRIRERKDADEEERARRANQRLADQVVAIQEANMTELEVLNEHLVTRQEILNAALENKMISEEEHRRQSELLELQHQARIGDVHAQGVIARRNFEQRMAKQQTQIVLNELLAMTQGLTTHSRTWFNINKAAGIANAIVNTYEGVTKALAKYPPPLSFVMAAAQLAAGLAQVQVIRSASFGTSTSAPSVGGGGATPVTPAEGAPAAPVVPLLPVAQAVRPQVNIVVEGAADTTKSVTYDQIINEIVPGLNEAFANGADIRLTLA